MTVHLPRLAALLLTSTLLAGCHFFVEFDRDRIGESPGTDAGPEPVCDTTGHTGCAADELCCDDGAGVIACEATGASQCEACGEACDADSTSGCVDRTCLCGTAPACAAPTPFCDDAMGVCVQCRTDGDCTGTDLCFGGACRACNPTDNSGCTNTTPICNATTFTCEACVTAPMDNCPAPLSCLASGACGGCDDNADCTTPTSGICDTASTVCRGCTDAADCMAELSLDICRPSGRCVTCDSTDNTGCDPASTSPICMDDGRANACRACAAGECPTGTPVCAGTGACVECTAADDSACTGPTPVCDTTSNVCVGCLGDADCGAQFCDTGTNTCTACTMSSQCAAHPVGRVCATGACVACDATSCPAGCCGSMGACVPYATQTDMICGTAGAACAACTTGQACGAAGACECTAASCPAGCCNGATCEAGTADALCGTGGAACSACVNGFACAAGACQCDEAADCDFGLCSMGRCDCDSSGGTGECALGEVCASATVMDCTCTGGSC